VRPRISYKTLIKVCAMLLLLLIHHLLLLVHRLLLLLLQGVTLQGVGCTCSTHSHTAAAAHWYRSNIMGTMQHLLLLLLCHQLLAGILLLCLSRLQP
jgi:hypothetical protein